MGLATPKQEIPENTWWWCHHHSFSGISYFWGSRVCQKYVVWVRVGCGIKFHIQRVPTRHSFDAPRYPKNKKYLKKWNDDVSPNRNLSKNTGRYVENTNTKSILFLFSSKINKYYFIILTIILLVHFRRPILSWNFL